MNERIHRALVWPASVRLLHGMMAATVLILCMTGLLLQSGLILNPSLHEHLLTVWHVPSGHILGLVLVARLGLLVFGKGVANWKALIPENLEGITATAVFYISMARMNLPSYFAHNPLWKVVYLVMFLLLVMQTGSGLLLESSWLQSVFRTDSFHALQQHQALFTTMLWIVLAHIITSILHDWKSPSSEISSMINGHKFFSVEEEKKVSSQQVSINLTDLTGKK